MRLVLLVPAVLVLLIALPAASAHLTVTATAPMGPLPYGMATSIPLDVSANCAVVLAEYDADSRSPLKAVLQPTSPSWITGVGSEIPFTFDMCNPEDANVHGAGTIAVTPGPFAPGLQTVNISIGVQNSRGEAEVGEALVPITVAYRGELNVSAPQETAVDNGTAQVTLTLDATLNADSMAMIEVTQLPEHGTIEGLPQGMIDVRSALAENKTNRVLTLDLTYTAKPDANFTMDMLGLRLMLHAAADMGQSAAPVDVMIHFTQAETVHDHDSHSHEEGNGVPGLDLSLLILALVMFALVVRRRN